jgi:hypothetical protein
MIRTDYQAKPTDYKIFVDASHKYSWWEKLRYWLKGEPLPLDGPVTVTLPKSSGIGRAYLIQKMDSSDHPVVIKIPEGDSYGTYELAKAEALALLLDCSTGKNKSRWEFANYNGWFPEKAD